MIEEYRKLANHLKIKGFTNDENISCDLIITSFRTADDYDIWIMSNDVKNLNWKTDVFYYIPPLDEIISRIKKIDKEDVIVYVKTENPSSSDEIISKDEVDWYLENLKIINKRE